MAGINFRGYFMGRVPKYIIRCVDVDSGELKNFEVPQSIYELVKPYRKRVVIFLDDLSAEYYDAE